MVVLYLCKDGHVSSNLTKIAAKYVSFVNHTIFPNLTDN